MDEISRNPFYIQNSLDYLNQTRLHLNSDIDLFILIYVPC
jgi:hypothetical protein